MSFVKIWVHLVFSTKYRKPHLKKEIKTKLIQHIIQNCKDKDIFLQAINGHDDHLHCLISLGKDQSISKVSQLIKGESSFWLNNEKLLLEKFQWQDDYYAVSVSESIVPKVIEYIKNQEAHHSKKTFSDEVDEFIEKYGFERTKDS